MHVAEDDDTCIYKCRRCYTLLPLLFTPAMYCIVTDVFCTETPLATFDVALLMFYCEMSFIFTQLFM